MHRVGPGAALALAVLAAGCGGGAGAGAGDEEREIRAVVGELQRASATKARAPRACALLTARAKAQLTAFVGAFGGGDSCEEIVGGSDGDTSGLKLGDVKRARVSVRGDLAVVRFRGRSDAIGLARVGGEWRIDNIVDPSLTPAPPRRIDPRLGRGSDEQQVLATYKAAADAAAAGDHARTCALFGYGAEAQLVIAQLLASLAGDKAPRQPTGHSCEASLAAIERVKGSAAALQGERPTASQLAAAVVTVKGDRATVRIPGQDTGHFVHEEGHWLVAPDPEGISAGG